MWPVLQKTKGNPWGSRDLGDSYVPLGPKEIDLYHISLDECRAIEDFFSGYPGAEDINMYAIYHWGRLKLPNKQIAQSQMKETEQCTDMAQMDCNIKVCHG